MSQNKALDLTPTFGWPDLRDYRGWVTGDPAPMPSAATMDAGMVGERVRLQGRTLTRRGVPLGKVRIEFWQADAGGEYHMNDYKLRGVAWSDADGNFFARTILPGYAGGIRHIKYLATASVRNRKQQLCICAGIYFATDEELSRTVPASERPYVRSGASVYRDDPAFLSLENLPKERRAARRL